MPGTTKQTAPLIAPATINTISTTGGSGGGGGWSTTAVGYPFGRASGSHYYQPRIQWQTQTSGATYCNAASLVR